MTQFDFGAIDPGQTSGAELAELLGDWRDALNSCHKGNARPTYALPGTLWLKNTSPNPTIMLFDGTADRAVSVISSFGGKAPDADKLDGLHASSFVRSNTTNSGPVTAKRFISTNTTGGGQDQATDFEDGIWVEEGSAWTGKHSGMGFCAALVAKLNDNRGFALAVEANDVFARKIHSSGMGPWQRLWSDANDATSFVTAGYCKLPNGLLMQWSNGSTVASNGATGKLIWFPIAFPNACLQVVATDVGAGCHSLGVSPESTSQFRVYARDLNNNFSNTGFRWIAVGH